MLIYYFDESTQKVEEILVKKLVLGVDHATATIATGQFKLIKINNSSSADVISGVPKVPYNPGGRL